MLKLFVVGTAASGDTLHSSDPVTFDIYRMTVSKGRNVILCLLANVDWLKLKL